MKERTWLGILLSFAAPCRGKMMASVALAVLSVAGGFVPYLGVYQIIRLFLERQESWEGILFWCGVCLAGYAVKVAGYALSTMLAHVSAYTILEGLRLRAADRLMGAPLGEVESRPIGAMKSTIVDRIEDIEPPLAHMIPELSSNILLPLVVVIAMFLIDWRMGLALLVTIPVALIPMAFGMRSYNKNYAAYMEANAHVNSVIVEYVEGIQVVKAFSQGERSYQKFARAVSSFKEFTMNWYRCTWASMNLCLSILPTTLLGTLPVGVYLYQAGVLDPAQVTLCLMMALGIVSPLMSATAFINSMKSMQFAVKDTPCHAAAGRILLLRRSGWEGSASPSRPDHPAGEVHRPGRPLRRRKVHHRAAGCPVLGCDQWLHHPGRARHPGTAPETALPGDQLCHPG